MNELQIFNNPQFGEIRTAGTADEPLFCAADVTRALGYTNGRDAISKHCDEGDVAKRDTPTSSGIQTMTFVNESGLYSLIFGSKLASARQFKQWVTSEVLPSIRKTGGYIATTADMTDEEIMARAILIGQRTIERQAARIAELQDQNQHQQKLIEQAKPKVQFAEAVGKCDDTIPVDLMAKLLAQNGVPNMGEKRLFDWFRRNGYISDQRSTWNRPYQKWVERGLFRVETSKWVDKSSGTVHLSYIPRITTKGQQYFVQKFCANLPQFFGTIQTINNIPT